MTNKISRLITLIAVCGMFAAVLTYSRAMAENPSDIYEEGSICTADTLDNDTFEVAPVSNAVPASDDVDINACRWGWCNTASDCPDDSPAAPFFCSNNCCVPW